MLEVKFYDWKKKRPKKHYLLVHEIRIFELIFSKKVSKFEMGLREIEKVTVFCLANENTDISYEVNRALGEIRIYVPYDFMDFLALNSVEEKYKEFCKLVRQYVIPELEENSILSPSIVKGYTEESLEEIVKQNYEGIFLVGKTPKKSPSRKKVAILKGIHRVKGFQLRCEVYDEKGLKIRDQLLVEEVGNEMVYARFLGTLKWESENLIVVQSKSSSWKEEIYL
ncbi:MULTISPECIES: hypothetical protein [Bacillus]|uniref:hypothetical protein n=1 Tax=Bacillus cereus group TaxID=86661 RepID=UPI00084C8F6A|nr:MULTISPECIES: hypothetical protein [Bacillus cereus group]MDA2088773.1 hypothetical protein [Bacillus cereus]MDA2404914.1 hypothetical protein [Bacillus cereus]MDA2427373.1 hypothetical protein [Bacillus cereus]MDD9280067.1 hypothetical protein [Bacillus thuringiensis]MDZ4643197.1 hypothetical protein [Bacillus cereus]